MNIFCIGRNYVAHIEELKNEQLDTPVIFLKPEGAIYKDKKYLIPTFTHDLHYECELIVKFDTDLPLHTVVQDWREVCAEISLGIDFTARDVQQYLKSKSLSWELAKAFDGAAILGEWLSLSSIPNTDDIHFDFYEGDNLLQHGESHLMIHNIGDTINYLLQYFSITKGDILFTGTPQGVGRVEEGKRYHGTLEGRKVLSFET